jgi:glycosyltransferase involved in cell wall biosynthesis
MVGVDGTRYILKRFLPQNSLFVTSFMLMDKTGNILGNKEKTSYASERLRPIGVVIPGFGHPQFLAEAIVSACTQEIDTYVPVVVVDDGCPFPESRQTVLGLMKQFPKQLYYVRQENKRLPGARNTGINFLMSLCPDMEAIYFLDADNRLAPYSLTSFRRALFSSDNIGWAYPDIGFFGQSLGVHGFEMRETAPEYSKLKHLVSNISEAGSLVKTELFQNNVMFDETLRSGFEDWDFWLSAIEQGYSGIRAESSGFFYRRRPESMLAEARREAEGLVSKLQTKHAGLYSRDYVAQLEHVEAPAFAVYISDRDKVLLFSDPLGELLECYDQQFDEMISNWLKNRRERFFPPHILIMPEAIWKNLLERKHFIRWFFWRVRSDAEKLEYYALSNGELPIIQRSSRGVSRETSILHVSSLCLAKLTQSDVATERSVVGYPTRSDVRIPAGDDTLDRPIKNPALIHERELRGCLLGLIEKHKPQQKIVGHVNRRYAGPDAAVVRGKIMQISYGDEDFEPFIVAETIRKRISLALNLDALSDNEPFNNALSSLIDRLQRQFSEIQGLFDRFAHIDFRHLQNSFTSLGYLNDVIINKRTEHEREYQLYLGRRVSDQIMDSVVYEHAMPTLGTSHVIIIGNAAFLNSLGEARAYGAKGILWLDRKFFKDDESFASMSDKALAYEHALDRIWCDDEQTRVKLSAMGIPPSKLIDSEKGIARVCG